MNDEDFAALTRARCAGPGRPVEHRENGLLTDCTPRAPMPDQPLHPVSLYHLPSQAASPSLAERVALGGVDGSAGTVGLLAYDWEYLAPMREGVVYAGSGGVVSAERFHDEDGELTHDDVAFSIELSDPAGTVVARITNHWRFRRVDGPTGGRPGRHEGSGEPIPGLTVGHVGVDRMKTKAALLRDPYPVHWDPVALAAAGLGDRPINQGPLNVSYIANMLMAWAGESALRRITVSFHGVVRDGDSVAAGGTVDDTVEVDGEQRHRCTVWLDRGDQRLVSGTAEVAV